MVGLFWTDRQQSVCPSVLVQFSNEKNEEEKRNGTGHRAFSSDFLAGERGEPGKMHPQRDPEDI